ncbi:MAG: hypothetical protein ACREMQ_07705, partial [Longimicrobiales bacterium]
MLSRLLARLRALLNLSTHVDSQFGRFRRELDAHVSDVQRAFKAQDVRSLLESQQKQVDRQWETQRAEYSELQRELAAMRAEMHERMLIYRLQLGRLTTLLENGSGARKAKGERLPIAVATPAAQGASSPAPAWEWLTLDRCPGCGTAERTIVCEWNKSIVLEQDVFADSPRYNYALCHG